MHSLTHSENGLDFIALVGYHYARVVREGSDRWAFWAHRIDATKESRLFMSQHCLFDEKVLKSRLYLFTTKLSSSVIPINWNREGACS